MSLAIDISRLEKVRYHPSGKIIARCPACAEAGGDRRGKHLAIFPNKAYACAAHRGDGDHRRRIKALVGFHSDSPPTPERLRQWKALRTEEHHRKVESQLLADTARKHRNDLVTRFAWHPADVWEDSPQRVDDFLVASCPRHFLTTLFPPDALLWTGEVHESGKPCHARCWHTCVEWLTASDRIGPMTTPAIWKSGTFSRSSANVASSPFVVLDFDGFDTIKPDTPEAILKHFLASLALIRWLREKLDWQLAAILHTGGKSLHAWFHSPPANVLQSLKDTAKPLGIDAGLVGRPEHPCRLPGQLHQKSGKLSRVLWLQRPDVIR